MPIVISGTNGISGVDGTASNPSYEGTDANTGVFFPAADTVAIGTNGTEALRVNSSQNVGIGTSSPAYRLDVRGGNIRLAANSSGASDAVLYFGNAATNYIFGGDSSNFMTFGTNNGERMRIDSSGNVGIGTSTVRAQTHVFGPGQNTANLTDAGNRGGMLRVSDNSTSAGGGGAILFASVQGDTANSTGFAAIKGLLANGNGNTTGDLAFSTRNATTDTALTERARIDSSGNLLVNQTSASAARICVTENLGATQDGMSMIDSGSSYGTGAVYIKFKNNATSTAGTIQHTASTTVAYSTSSDERLKENIVDAPSALNTVLNIPVRSYDWKEDKSNVEYGLIAQELAKVYAEPVGVGGEDEKEDPWNVEYGRLTPLLLKAIQEQQQMIETLQAKVAALEAK